MTAEEAIVAVEAEEAVEDKDKSNHWLIGGNNKDEGSNNDSGSVSSGGSNEIPATSPARFRRRLRRGSGSSGETVRRWLENSNE